MPRFLVKRVFEISDRQLFVLAGEIIEGEIAPNMFVSVPFNSRLSLSLQINSIEFALHEGRENVCLCIGSNNEGLDIVRGLNLSGETLEIKSQRSTEL